MPFALYVQCKRGGRRKRVMAEYSIAQRKIPLCGERFHYTAEDSNARRKNTSSSYAWMRKPALVSSWGGAYWIFGECTLIQGKSLVHSDLLENCVTTHRKSYYIVFFIDKLISNKWKNYFKMKKPNKWMYYLFMSTLSLY